jgi:hypothetical protein
VIEQPKSIRVKSCAGKEGKQNVQGKEGRNDIFIRVQSNRIKVSSDRINFSNEVISKKWNNEHGIDGKKAMAMSHRFFVSVLD